MTTMFGAGLIGCEQKGPVEEARAKIDEAVEEAGEKLEEASEKKAGN